MKKTKKQQKTDDLFENDNDDRLFEQIICNEDIDLPKNIAGVSVEGDEEFVRDMINRMADKKVKK